MHSHFSFWVESSNNYLNKNPLRIIDCYQNKYSTHDRTSTYSVDCMHVCLRTIKRLTKVTVKRLHVLHYNMLCITGIFRGYTCTLSRFSLIKLPRTFIPMQQKSASPWKINLRNPLEWYSCERLYPRNIPAEEIYACRILSIIGTFFRWFMLA